MPKKIKNKKTRNETQKEDCKNVSQSLAELP